MQQLDKISQLQHQRATETLRQRVEGELQNVKEELKKVHKRTVETYLRNKEDHENTTLEQLSDIYIELRVHGTEEEYRRLEKRSTINYLEQEMDMERCRQINAQELFSPDHRNAKTPLKVLVIGKAGIGKTMFTLNVLDVWQKEGQLSSKFDNVNFFSLRDLSHVGKCSLADLLFTHQGIPKPSNDAIFEYLTHMQRTLLIFDALDEFGSYSSASESKAYDHNEEVEISQLIGSIICGKMLKLASLLVTSRPGGVSEHKVFDRIAEIYGFVESRIFEYVSKFCNGNCNLESHIRAYVKHNTNIRSLCYVPMLCNLVCRIAKMNMEHDSKVPLPATVTQLLTTCVVHFAIEHHPNFKGKELAEDDDIIAKIKDPLLNHSTLAKHGMSQQPIQVVFSNDELKECQLSQETATQCGLLTVSRVKAPGQLCRKVKQLFYFFHLIVEEFFASIALISNEQEIKTVMKQTQNEGQLDMVLVFISGLVGDPDNKQFLQSLGHQTSITASDLLRLVINQEREQRRRDHKSGILLLLLLVYESRQSDLWVQIKDFVLKDGKELNLAETHMSPVEQKSLAYVMTKCDDLTILNLDRCNLCGRDLVVGLGDLSQLRELWLGNNRNLHGPEITTALIDSLLKLPQLEILHLSICDLTDEDVTRLASVLPHLGLLKLLGLGGNSITDKGALNVTAAAVKLPHLENFWLQDNWLSETGVKVVRRAFYCARGPGRVAIPGMELQRPPGEVAIHHDPVVYWQRRVANYEMALARLSRQRVEDMASCLETEVIKMLDFIAVSKEQLRLVQNIRDRTSETAEDRRLDDERSIQMHRKFNRMGMGQRPQ